MGVTTKSTNSVFTVVDPALGLPKLQKQHVVAVFSPNTDILVPKLSSENFVVWVSDNGDDATTDPVAGDF